MSVPRELRLAMRTQVTEAAAKAFLSLPGFQAKGVAMLLGTVLLTAMEQLEGSPLEAKAAEKFMGWAQRAA